MHELYDSNLEDMNGSHPEVAFPRLLSFQPVPVPVHAAYFDIDLNAIFRIPIYFIGIVQSCEGGTIYENAEFLEMSLCDDGVFKALDSNDCGDLLGYEFNNKELEWKDEIKIIKDK